MRYWTALALLLLASCGDDAPTMTPGERADLEWRFTVEAMTPEAQGLTAAKIQMELRHSLERIKHEMRWSVLVDGESKEYAAKWAKFEIDYERDSAINWLDILNDVRAKQAGRERETRESAERSVRAGKSFLEGLRDPDSSLSRAWRESMEKRDR